MILLDISEDANKSTQCFNNKEAPDALTLSSLRKENSESLTTKHKVKEERLLDIKPLEYIELASDKARIDCLESVTKNMSTGNQEVISNGAFEEISAPVNIIDPVNKKGVETILYSKSCTDKEEQENHERSEREQNHADTSTTKNRKDTFSSTENIDVTLTQQEERKTVEKITSVTRFDNIKEGIPKNNQREERVDNFISKAGLIENIESRKEILSNGKEGVSTNKSHVSLVEKNSSDEIEDDEENGDNEITDEKQTKCCDSVFEKMDGSEFEKDLADDCEETSGFENKSFNLDSEVLILANQSACDGEMNGDITNIATKHVSRKSYDSKKLIWEVHSDTFIKNTKKSGWKVSDKINDSVQKGTKTKQEVLADNEPCSHSQSRTNELLPLESMNDKEDIEEQLSTQPGLKILKSKSKDFNITKIEHCLSESEIETKTKLNEVLEKSSEHKRLKDISNKKVAMHKTGTNETKQVTESMNLNLQETKGEILGSSNLEPSPMKIDTYLKDDKKQITNEKVQNNIPIMVESKVEDITKVKGCRKNTKIETDTLNKSHEDKKSCMSSQMIDKEAYENPLESISSSVIIEQNKDEEIKVKQKHNEQIQDNITGSDKAVLVVSLGQSDESTQTLDMQRQEDPATANDFTTISDNIMAVNLRIDSNTMGNTLETLPKNNQNSKEVLEVEKNTRIKTPDAMVKSEAIQSKEAQQNVEELLLNSELPDIIDDPEFENRLKVFHNYKNFGAMYTAKKNFKKAEWAFKNGIKQTAGKPARSKEQLRRIIMAEIEFRLARAR